MVAPVLYTGRKSFEGGDDFSWADRLLGNNCVAYARRVLRHTNNFFKCEMLCCVLSDCQNYLSGSFENTYTCIIFDPDENTLVIWSSEKGETILHNKGMR